MNCRPRSCNEHFSPFLLETAPLYLVRLASRLTRDERTQGGHFRAIGRARRARWHHICRRVDTHRQGAGCCVPGICERDGARNEKGQRQTCVATLVIAAQVWPRRSGSAPPTHARMRGAQRQTVRQRRNEDSALGRRHARKKQPQGRQKELQKALPPFDPATLGLQVKGKESSLVARGP